MNRVVVTGLGVISPVGNSVSEFWQSLQEGKLGIGPLTKFDTEGFKVNIAAEVKDFDPFKYMDKDVVRKNDLFTRYAVAAAVQAMEDSGLKDIDPYRLGVYFGSGIGGIQTLTDEQDRYRERGARRVSPLFIPMMIANMAAGVISIQFGAKGPCLPVVTACATGTHEIGEAFRAIKFGYADAIIAGGAEAAVTPLAVAGFTNCMALNTCNDPARASIPFDKERGGFVIGEGAGALVLEEYEHAVRRGATIYAELKGYGNTCDAYHMTAPIPDGSGGAAAIAGAVKEAGGADGQIYINAHGTGTPLNDKSETLAIKLALGEQKARETLISSTKSMTGHMLGAAGAVEAVAAVLALRDGIAPPTIGYQTPDPECDLDYVPNTMRKADIDMSLSISLGFGGHNACIAFGRCK